MAVTIRKYTPADVPQMIRIWNEVVEDGIAFPQLECLDVESGTAFFGEQSHCGVAESESGELLGLYILHPNNVGRCGHICNASYAVASSARGKHIGEALVCDSIEQGKVHGFRILQFNAVVRSNTAARKLYEKLGFTPLGIIPNGFLSKSGEYVDIVLYFIEF